MCHATVLLPKKRIKLKIIELAFTERQRALVVIVPVFFYIFLDGKKAADKQELSLLFNKKNVSRVASHKSSIK